MTRVITAPELLRIEENETSIFLGGSIEMDTAEEWQKRFIGLYEETEDIVFINPRRKEWDSSWEQSANDPNFSQQVNWELDGLETADWILIYFDPKTKSPVSLLELGLFTSGKLVVVCPDGFWRKGNVEIVCGRYGIAMCETLEDAQDFIDNGMWRK